MNNSTDNNMDTISHYNMSASANNNNNNAITMNTTWNCNVNSTDNNDENDTIHTKYEWYVNVITANKKGNVMIDYNLNIRSEISVSIGEHYDRNMIITNVGTVVLM